MHLPGAVAAVGVLRFIAGGVLRVEDSGDTIGVRGLVGQSIRRAAVWRLKGGRADVVT